jgi:hypothetical protein
MWKPEAKLVCFCGMSLGELLYVPKQVSMMPSKLILMPKFVQQNVTFKTDLDMNVAKLVCLWRMSLGELLYVPKQVSMMLLKLKQRQHLFSKISPSKQTLKWMQKPKAKEANDNYIMLLNKLVWCLRN